MRKLALWALAGLVLAVVVPTLINVADRQIREARDTLSTWFPHWIAHRIAASASLMHEDWIDIAHGCSAGYETYIEGTGECASADGEWAIQPAQNAAK